MYAAKGGSVEIFNRLFELGADPLAADEVRAVCMYCTVFCVRLCCSYLALTYRTLIVAWLQWRRTTLMYASKGGSVEIFNRLLELGADPMAADDVSLLRMSSVCLSACHSVIHYD